MVPGIGELVGEAVTLAECITEFVISALAGGPVRSVLACVILVSVIGCFLSWWAVAGLAAALLAWVALAPRVLPSNWTWRSW